MLKKDSPGLVHVEFAVSPHSDSATRDEECNFVHFYCFCLCVIHLQAFVMSNIEEVFPISLSLSVSCFLSALSVY